MRWATVKQPVVRGSGEDVTELAISMLGAHEMPGLLDRVADDLRARTATGVETYGFELRCHNQRHPLVDAYQEALDAYKYLTQALHEGYAIGGLHATQRQLLIGLRAALEVASAHHQADAEDRMGPTGGGVIECEHTDDLCPECGNMLVQPDGILYCSACPWNSETAFAPDMTDLAEDLERWQRGGDWCWERAAVAMDHRAGAGLTTHAFELYWKIDQQCTHGRHGHRGEIWSGEEWCWILQSSQHNRPMGLDELTEDRGAELERCRRSSEWLSERALDLGSPLIFRAAKTEIAQVAVAVARNGRGDSLWSGIEWASFLDEEVAPGDPDADFRPYWIVELGGVNE